MSRQLVLEPPLSDSNDLSRSALFVPFICSTVSATILIIQYYLRDLDLRLSISTGTLRKTTLTSSGYPVVTGHGHGHSRGAQSTTRPVSLWKILRLVACFFLILLAIISVAMAESCPKVKDTKPGNLDASIFIKHGFGKHHKHPRHSELCLSREQSARLSLTFFYVRIFFVWV